MWCIAIWDDDNAEAPRLIYGPFETKAEADHACAEFSKDLMVYSVHPFMNRNVRDYRKESDSGNARGTN